VSNKPLTAGWFPMDTAPRDGTYILVHCRNWDYQYSVAYWFNDAAEDSNDDFSWRETSRWTLVGDESIDCEFYSWQPFVPVDGIEKEPMLPTRLERDRFHEKRGVFGEVDPHFEWQQARDEITKELGACPPEKADFSPSKSAASS